MKTQKVVSPWENGPTRYRVYGGDNPNGIEWEVTLPRGASVGEDKAARAKMDEVYNKLMGIEPITTVVEEAPLYIPDKPRARTVNTPAKPRSKR